jgi:hypothetical protein
MRPSLSTPLLMRNVLACCDQRLQLDIELGAEAAAEEWHNDANAVLRPAEQPRDLDPHERRALRGGVDGDARIPSVRHRHERLERQVQTLLGAKGVLEYMRRRRKGGGRIAAPQPEIKRYVGAPAPLEVLQVGERAGGLELLMHVHVRARGLDLVEHGGKLLVLGHDQLGRFLGHVRVGREHDRHRLADVMHLIDGEDRLVVKRRTVIGIGYDLADVGGGEHAVHAGDRARRAGIDRADAPVRHRAAEDLTSEHAGQPQRVHVLGAPGDLVARFQPRERAADLTAPYGGRRHQFAPLLASAWRTARPT